jgi:hypothetical protein
MDTVRKYTCPSCKAFIEVQKGASTCTCPGCKKKFLIRKTDEGEVLHELTKPSFFHSTFSPLVQHVITAAVIVVFAYAAYFYILDLANVIPGIDEYLPTADSAAAEEEREESTTPGSLVTVDPFRDVTILFRGVNGRATACADIVTDNEALKSLRYSLEPNSNLSSGDRMTLKVVSTDEEIAALGLKLSETKKEYQVGSLDRYVSYLDEIPDEVLGKIYLAGLDKLENTYKNYGDYEAPVVTRTQGWTYDRMYLLNSKEDESNYLFVQYKSKYSDGTNETVIFNTVRFRCLVLKTDNSVDCTYDGVPVSRMNHLFGSSLLGASGYEDETELFNQVIRPLTENYLLSEGSEEDNKRMVLAADKALAARLYAQQHPENAEAADDT